MDCSMPGLPVHHQLPKFTQTHVHWVSDAIQPSHPLSSPSPPSFNLSIVHGILQARILEWRAFTSSKESSQPRDQTQVSRIAGGFSTSWATREARVPLHVVNENNSNNTTFCSKEISTNVLMSSCYILLLHREKEQRKEKQKTQTGRKETFVNMLLG